MAGNMKLRTLAITIGTVAALAGCTEGTQTFNSEVGSTTEGSLGFGSAIAQNQAMMSGDKSYVINMTRKFAADVPNTVHFAFNSSVLDVQARNALSQQANWIRQNPEVRFRVYGHTDLVGSNAYNKALGLRRARAVVNFLVSQGISRSRLEALVSYGETHPLVYTQAPNEQNRRTVTEVSGFVTKGKPMLLDGKYAAVIYRDYIASAAASSGDSGGGD